MSPLAMLTLLAALASDNPAVDEDADSIRGTVGVCIRWADDPHHVAEAIVVAPSGNMALDEAIPRSVRNMRWDRPDGKYQGDWVGITLAVGEPAPPNRPLPSCKHLPRPAAKVVPTAV